MTMLDRAAFLLLGALIAYLITALYYRRKAAEQPSADEYKTATEMYHEQKAENARLQSLCTAKDAKIEAEHQNGQELLQRNYELLRMLNKHQQTEQPQEVEA